MPSSQPQNPSVWEAPQYTPGEERSQVVDTKGPGGQDIIVLELGDDVNEGVLEGWLIHHAVLLVQQEQLPSNFKAVFWRLGRQHTCYSRGRELPCVVHDLVQYVVLQFPLGLKAMRRIFGTLGRGGRGGCGCHGMSEVMTNV